VQLEVSLSLFRESVKKGPQAAVIMGRGMIACSTPAFRTGGMIKDITRRAARASISVRDLNRYVDEDI